ncbi:RDD family protein [Simiduia sp. 21SJ11W-1]|uniref:RDD family protein n=1 Tax=Simiduia sp. 21SJ11W-1 TaxID=2909669 RepID=UPI00209E62C3|nr:RDD family protein [Simiduia sp. 21SJ11W-1]UTA49159.1 RDD family protein [Simiduia sp. 21SJ11W-1]
MTDIQYPSLLRRLGAMLYDFLLVIAVSIAYGAAFLWAKVAVFGYVLAEGEKANLGWPGFIGWLLLLALYFVFFWVKSGQTLGMKTWRIAVLDPTGKRLTVKAAITRWLLAWASALALGLGYLWALIDKDSQTLHDLLSHSRTHLLPKHK